MGSKVQVADAGRGESWKQPLCSGLRVAAQTGPQEPVPSWISTFHRNLSVSSEPSLAGKLADMPRPPPYLHGQVSQRRADIGASTFGRDNSRLLTLTGDIPGARAPSTHLRKELSS